MKIYIYTNSLTEQSIRQISTLLYFIDCDEIYLDNKWKNIWNKQEYHYSSLDNFLKLNGGKGIIFFNIIEGIKLLKNKKTKNTKFIFRIRGLGPEESFYKNHNLLKKISLNLLEKLVISNTDYFLFLNKKQKKYYGKKYPKQSKITNHSFILPNVKKNNNTIINHEKSKIELVYSGGFSKWQNIEKVFQIASEIVTTIDANFTILTFQRNFIEASSLAKKYNINKNFTVKYVQPEKIENELSNYDLGIILRDDHIINQTASPFKIIDYISNGLGLIITDNFEEQVSEMIDDRYFFKISLKDDQLRYSEDKLIKFVLKFKDKYIRNKILSSYKVFFESIEKISFKE